MSTEYKVGHKFWWVYNTNSRTQREVTVEKVGRVWLTLSNGHRVYKTTLVAFAGDFASPGTCWLSKEAYEHHVRRERAWGELKSKLRDSWGVPDNVTLEDIKAAAMYLKMEIKV